MSRIRVPEHVVARVSEVETVLLNMQTGQYHGLNPTGARMFALLRETGSAPATAEAIAVEYEVPVEAVAEDLEEFCHDLAERGLIVCEDASG